MYKRIIWFTLIITALFAISYNLHHYLNTQLLNFSLFQVYIFYAISAVLIYIMIEVVANHLPNQAGYAYLMGMFLKIGIFILIFQESVFAKEELLDAERIALVLPFFLFLLVEVVGVAKLLNSK